MTHPMIQAANSATEGVSLRDGGPFGACIVKDDTVISVAHNTVVRDNDPTCHAEMNAIRMASRFLGTWNLKDCEIYTTAEPCPMCLGAIYWSRLKKIHAGLTKEDVGSFGWDDLAFYQELALPLEARQVPIILGIHPEACQKPFEKWAHECGESARY